MNFWIVDDMIYEESRDVMSIAGRARQAGKTEMLTAQYMKRVMDWAKLSNDLGIPIITAAQTPYKTESDLDFYARRYWGLPDKPAQTEAKEVTPLDTWCKDIEAYLNKVIKERTMKYKIGDRVRVISLEEARKFEGVPDYHYAPLMYNFCDSTVTISDIEKGKYRIKEDQGVWCWRDADFVGLAEKEKGMWNYYDMSRFADTDGTNKEKTMTKQELLDKIAKLKKEQQEIEAQLKKMPKYPCIKRVKQYGFTDVTILFTSKDTGTVLASNSTLFYPIGKYSETWNESAFNVEYNTFTVKVGE